MTNTKGVTMTAEDEKLCNLDTVVWAANHGMFGVKELVGRVRALSAENASLTAELETLRKVTETGSYTAEVELHLAEEAKSMALIIGLKDELAKARGRCEVCGWRWHWDFDPEQGTGEQP